MKAVGAPSGDAQRPVDLRVGAGLHRPHSVIPCPLSVVRWSNNRTLGPMTTNNDLRRTIQRRTAFSAPDYLGHRDFHLLLRARHLGTLRRVDRGGVAGGEVAGRRGREAGRRRRDLDAPTRRVAEKEPGHLGGGPPRGEETPGRTEGGAGAA